MPLPGFVVHTLMGSRLLADGVVRSVVGPSPAERTAFLAGSLGPDMGMYPGGEPIVADLAHYVRTGELARCLVAEAADGVDRAFAWGWAAHALADALIHPLVNVAAGDHRQTAALTYADDPWAHVAVETGADARFFVRWRAEKIARVPARLDRTSELLARAYGRVYQRAFDPDLFRSTVTAWNRWHRFAIAAAGTAAKRLYESPYMRRGLDGLVQRLARTYTGAFDRGSPLHAITHPVAPSERAMALIETGVAEFPTRFGELVAGGIDSLPDYNLDTGTVETEPAYPRTVATLARLAAG